MRAGRIVDGMEQAMRVGIWVLVLGASAFMAVLGVIGLLVKAQAL